MSHAYHVKLFLGETLHGELGLSEPWVLCQRKHQVLDAYVGVTPLCLQLNGAIHHSLKVAAQHLSSWESNLGD